MQTQKSNTVIIFFFLFYHFILFSKCDVENVAVFDSNQILSIDSISNFATAFTTFKIGCGIQLNEHFNGIAYWI